MNSDLDLDGDQPSYSPYQAPEPQFIGNNRGERSSYSPNRGVG